MPRVPIYIGPKLATPVDLYGPQSSWPDKDLSLDGGGARVEGSGELVAFGQLRNQGGKLRAIALGYDTDWDFVRIRPAGVDLGASLILGPGRVLLIPDGVDRFVVEPHVDVPSTRLYDASVLRSQQAQAPVAAPGWQIKSSTNQFFNASGAAVTVYKWNGHAWAVDEVVADQAPATHPLANGNGATNRACDYSPDGIWNFADYVAAGLILAYVFEVNPPTVTATPPLYVSVSPTDSRGNPGDVVSPTAKLYNPNFADPSGLFYGRLALDLWIDDCPPPGYVPRLAPVRHVTLGAQVLAAGAAAPNTAILTVPAFNIERAQFLFKNAAGGGNVFAQIVQPRAQDWIDQADGVADPDPSTGALFSTVATGEDAVVFIEEPIGPFIKVVLGSDTGATIPKGAVLELTRRWVP